MAIPSVIILVKSKKIKEVFTLASLSLIIPLFHLALTRYATLDKHMYLSIIFLASIIGYAVAIFLKKGSTLMHFAKYSLPILAFMYFIYSYNQLFQFEHTWKNTRVLSNFLKTEVKPENKILTESGGATILALYDNIFPPKGIVTFDWIDYSGLTGNEAYLQAIKDGYFDYIELSQEREEQKELSSLIRIEMAASYSLIFKADTFEVYERNL